MRKLLIAILVVAGFASCKKEKEDPNAILFQTLVNKLLICDSMKVTSSTTAKTFILGKGKGQDIKFDSYAGYYFYGNPAEEGSYQLVPPQKLYLIYKQDPDQSREYTILSITDRTIVLRFNESSTNETVDRYYRAE